MRIGHGYDVHRLVEGRPLILGGTVIPFEKGLEGHSDADVLIHAVMDALLGAASMPDIGHLFPDTDPAYQGISSLNLLKQVYFRLANQGWRIENVDITMIAQRPRLAPYLTTMRESMATALQISFDQINIKATTEEGMGFTGSGEGMACHAVCLIERSK